jgi:selenocysteine lyase/cysteine desulfurase
MHKDAFPSMGIVPVDVKQWQTDAVFGSCVKWLCGGPCAGFMYVKDALLPSRLM